MRFYKLEFLMIVMFFLYQPVKANNNTNSIDLAGKWGVKLDPRNVGIEQEWFMEKMPDSIHLPGSLADGGYGVKNNYADPSRLSRTYKYVGAAWYQKQVDIPEQWQGKIVYLLLERCHWQTHVWVNDQWVGTENSLCTPHRYDLTRALKPGSNRITIRVDNRMKINVGKVAHSITDETQTNWNGIIGKMQLLAYERVHMQKIGVYPDLQNKRVRVKIWFDENTPLYAGIWGTITLKAQSFNTDKNHRVKASNHRFLLLRPYREFSYDMGDNILLWDEFDPALYKLEIHSAMEIQGHTYTDSQTVVFGMREFATRGSNFTLNNRLTFLRGTLECCIFPLTGYPAMDVDYWLKMFRTIKAHGLNHMRFHSWCPPQAAFQAADLSGVYLQIETPVWTVLGDNQPIDRFVYLEGDRILASYGNHPSFCMLAVGNETAGLFRKKYLNDILLYWKDKDKRHLYTGSSGFPIVNENQYHLTSRPRLSSGGRGSGYGGSINAEQPSTTLDFADFVTKYDVPVVSHEIGQWCVYPNFDEMEKYTGVLEPRNFERFKKSLNANGLGDKAHDFLMASGKLQALLYKAEIEAAMRTPGFGGFQLLDLHDFPGQGTALVGVLDPFWESKGYIDPQEYKRFCNTTVPIARMEKRVWTTDETFAAKVQVAHFGRDPLTHTDLVWQIMNVRNNQLVSGKLENITIPKGNSKILGEIRTPLFEFDAPAQLRLTLFIEKTDFINQWDIWVYPESPKLKQVPKNIKIVHVLDEQTIQYLQTGQNVLLVPEPESIKGEQPMSFAPIFWNTRWFVNQKVKTLGILCDPKHPALAAFPTDFHSNWQWWELLNMDRAMCMMVDDLPAAVEPIIQPIDDWNSNRRLALLFEARVDAGHLLVCSMDITHDLDNRPVARQMRTSLLKYMQSDQFQPKVALPVPVVQSIFNEKIFIQKSH